jgi:transposase-like protein
MAQTGVSMEAKLLAVFSSGVPLKVTALCRELDISRQTLYKYRRRFEVEGPAGLVERSRRPHSSPRQVSAETEEAIVRLRKELRVDCGAQSIAYQLERRGQVVPSVATIHRVLVRRGMVTPQPHKRPKVAWQRFEWPRPNDAWQIDATSWALSDGQTVWIMDVLDDHSRALVAARVDTGPTARIAWEAFTTAVLEWGLPAQVMNDNGSGRRGCGSVRVGSCRWSSGRRSPVAWPAVLRCARSRPGWVAARRRSAARWPATVASAGIGRPGLRTGPGRRDGDRRRRSSPSTEQWVPDWQPPEPN